MKTTTVLAALSLLCTPVLAQNSKKPSASSPSNIGNVSSTGQSLRYKRPSKRRLSSGSPGEIRTTTSGQSLRYRGPGHRSPKRHSKKSRAR